MKDSIKIFSGIAGSAFVKWVLIVGIGFFLCILGLFISIIIFVTNEDYGYAGARSGGVIGLILTFLIIFLNELWGALLLVISSLFTGVYFAMANKYALRITFYKIWQLKANDFLKRKIEIYIEKLSIVSPHWLKEVGSPVKAKLKLMDQVSKDKEVNFFQKRILRFGLKMVKLDSVDMTKDNISLSEIIYDKIDQQISAMSKPSLKWFYITIVFHFCVIILALAFSR